MEGDVGHSSTIPFPRGERRPALCVTTVTLLVRVSLSHLRKLSISPFICATTFRLISSDKISGKVANLWLHVPSPTARPFVPRIRGPLFRWLSIPLAPVARRPVDRRIIAVPNYCAVLGLLHFPDWASVSWGFGHPYQGGQRGGSMSLIYSPVSR